MPEVEVEVDTVEVRWLCEILLDDENKWPCRMSMGTTGQSLDTFPASYEHMCANGHTKWSEKRYPYTVTRVRGEK